VLSALLGPVLLWLGTVLVADHRLRTPAQADRAAMDITLPLVVLTALLAGLAGWGALALLERWPARVRRPVTVWRVLAVAMLLLSFGPLMSAGMEPTTRAVLAAMHIAVAVVLIPGLPGRPRSAGPAGDDSDA